MKIRKYGVSALKVTAVLAASVLFLSACFGGGDKKSSKAIEYINVYTVKSGTGIIPQHADELATSRMMNSLWSGLVYVDPSAQVQNEIAKSIETTDNRVWNIKLRDDFKFTNGEKVTAKSFTKAWNFAARISNAMGNRGFLANFEGFTEDGDTDLSGIKLVNDYEIQVTLKTPNRNFLANLAGNVFLPLPEAAYKDIEKFGLEPIGNGPYKLVKYTPDVEMRMEKNPDYKGPRKPKNDGLKYTIYADSAAAYRDLIAGNLDALDDLPAEALASFKNDLGDRWGQKPAMQTWYLIINSEVPHFGFDEEGTLRRKALSMAIDRNEIGERIFYGTRFAAEEFTAPSLLSYKAGIAGSDVLKFNAAKAKELWAQANAISPWNAEDTLYLNYAMNRGDKPMYEAMAHSITDALGIKAEASANPDWKTNKERGLEQKQPFRMSWSADWPAPDVYLTIIFGTDAPSNYSGYSNPEFEKLLTAGDAALGDADAAAEYFKAQEMLFNQMPVLPILYGNGTVGWSERVKKVTVDWNGLPVYYEIEKK